MPAFDWNKSCAYDELQQQRFHREARKRLKQLAQQLGLPSHTFGVHSEKGGIAGSGEVTLRGEAIYVQVSQSTMGAETGILVRACKGRQDFVGGPNNFVGLIWLDNIEGLAGYCRRVLDRDGGRP
jgi:hypothetical protein